MAVELPNPKNISENIECVKSVLNKNNFPPEFYESVIENSINQMYNSEQNVKQNTKPN